MVRNANEDHVWCGARNLLAGPSGRAFRFALLCTNAFAHVTDAPSAQAIFIIVARIEKAPVAGRATGLDILLGQCVRVTVWRQDFLAERQVWRDARKVKREVQFEIEGELLDNIISRRAAWGRGATAKQK